MYEGIRLRHDVLRRLPIDGVPEDVDEVVDEGGEEGTEAAPEVDAERQVEQADSVVTGVNDAVDPLQEVEKIRNLLQWPDRAPEPASEYNTAGFWSMCYPTLFPTGAADISNVGANGVVRDVSLADWAEFLMQWKDGRFARHPRWRYHVFNMLQRQRARMTGKVFVNHKDGQADMTLDELQELLRAGDTAISKRLFHFGAQLRGTPAWKRARRGELLDMMEEHGLPHFFMTWSAADVQWKHLQENLMAAEGDAAEEVDDDGRNRRVNDNPALVDEFFVKRVELFMSTLAAQGMGVADYWIIFEWQGRGSVHAHGVFWLRPGLCPIADVEAVVKDPTRHEEQQQLLTFYDEYCSAWNPVSFTAEALDEMLQRPEEHPHLANPPLPLPPNLPHPCRTPFDQDDPRDLGHLANFCNRHKKCSPQTCLKKRGGEWKCKTGAPWKLKTRSSFSDEGRKPGDVVYVPARNDPLMNTYPIKADAYQCWRANMDIKPVTSRHAMVQYLTKYCTKHEPASDTLKDVIRRLQDKEGTRSVDAFSKALSGSVGDRDYTAQEVAHHLLGLPGFLSSRTFQTASLSGTRAWSVEGEAVQLSVWEIYEKRPEVCEDLSFHDFVAKWRFERGQYTLRQKDVVPRIFPRIYCASSTDERFEQWCRLQLRIHVACRDEAELQGHGSWEEALREAVRNAAVPARVAAELARLTVVAGDDDAADEDDSTNDDEERQPAEQEDYMQAGDLNVEFDEDQAEDAGPPFDPAECWEHLKRDHGFSDNTLRDAGEFIKRHRMDFALPATNYAGIDAGRLNAGQRLAFEVLRQAVDNAVQPQPADRPCAPTRMLISGTAGTGKSFMIKCLVKHCIEEFGADRASHVIHLAAPTGTAAFNIGGRTIHSLLALPVPLCSSLPDLSPGALVNLQQRLLGLRVLVIDEMSMVGRRFLAAIDGRLRHIFPAHRDWFGGVSVVMMGDFGQLPPVLDLPMYAKAAGQGLSHTGREAFASFNQAVVLQKVERLAGEAPDVVRFKEILARLRTGQVTHEDWQVLMKQSAHRLPPDAMAAFQNAQVLVSTHEAEVALNRHELRQLPAAKVRIDAVHAGPGAASAKAEDAGGLSSILTLATGARVMLRQNLWVDAGLTNGALGTVLGVLYDPNGCQPPALPIAALIQLDDYRGPSFLADVPRVVPVPTSTTRWMKGERPCSRTQLPLCLAFAITIHKSQGWTRDHVRVDIGTSEHSLGITFVACSRVTAPSGLCFQPANLRASMWTRFEKLILQKAMWSVAWSMRSSAGCMSSWQLAMHVAPLYNSL